MLTNLEVAQAWGAGRPATSGHMHTNGAQLYSYALLIGEHRDGLPVVFNYTATPDHNPFGHEVPALGSRSHTTSCHVGIARRIGYAFER